MEYVSREMEDFGCQVVQLITLREAPRSGTLSECIRNFHSGAMAIQVATEK